MAPRAYWKGYLKLSLVSCPIALFPATSESEKISFHQLNKKTGHRIKYRKVDAESGDEVDSADIIKGYEVGKGDYIELDPEELEAVAIESKRTIDIDEFVPKDEIDELYLNNPYYIAPDGEVGQNGKRRGPADKARERPPSITRRTGRAFVRGGGSVTPRSRARQDPTQTLPATRVLMPCKTPDVRS